MYRIMFVWLVAVTLAIYIYRAIPPRHTQEHMPIYEPTGKQKEDHNLAQLPNGTSFFFAVEL